METLETMGKIAGIGGLALGTFLVLFRDVIRKSIFSKLSKDQSYKLIRLILILVWTIAIAGITAWLIAPMVGQVSKVSDRVVVSMDTPFGRYDPENNTTGRTNYDEIYDALKDVRGMSLIQEQTNADWNRHEDVKAKNPDLIIIHWSAFARETVEANQHGEARRLEDFFRYMQDSKAKFLVYSRADRFESDEGQGAWIQSMETRFSQLKGRIQFFNFVPGKKKLFRDPDVQRELKMQVKKILGIQ